MSGRAHILVIDAGGTFFKSGLIDEDGHVLNGSRISCPVDSDGEAENVRKVYHTVISRQMETASLQDAAVAAVGVDTPGPFDYKQGKSCMKHKFKALYGIPIRPWIEEATGGIPINFIHDSTAFVLGEYWKGKLQGNENGAGVMLGTGLGFAYMCDGVVQLNQQGGPKYSLYSQPFRNGKAEDYVSRRGICRRYRERMPQSGLQLDVVDIANLAKAGDQAARETMEETGEMLGEILTPVLETIACHQLVIGGQICKAYPYFSAPLEQILKNIGVERVAPSQNPDNSHLLGCAYASFCVTGKGAVHDS